MPEELLIFVLLTSYPTHACWSSVPVACIASGGCVNEIACFPPTGSLQGKEVMSEPFFNCEGRKKMGCTHSQPPPLCSFWDGMCVKQPADRKNGWTDFLALALGPFLRVQTQNENKSKSLWLSSGSFLFLIHIHGELVRHWYFWVFFLFCKNFRILRFFSIRDYFPCAISMLCSWFLTKENLLMSHLLTRGWSLPPEIQRPAFQCSNEKGCGCSWRKMFWLALCTEPSLATWLLVFGCYQNQGILVCQTGPQIGDGLLLERSGVSFCDSLLQPVSSETVSKTCLAAQFPTASLQLCNAFITPSRKR